MVAFYLINIFHRFEMPYNIWCNGCGKHIGMGVRYNAEKSKAGNYYTTPIWQFRMKCHLCDQYFVIKTDPAVSVANCCDLVFFSLYTTCASKTLNPINEI